MELMLLGEAVDAERAYQVGMVNKVVPQANNCRSRDALRPAVLPATRPGAGAVKGIREQVLPKGPSEHVARGRLAIAARAAERDAKEGVAGFKAKRKPRFKGK